MSSIVDSFKEAAPLVGALAVAGSLLVLSLASRVSVCCLQQGDCWCRSMCQHLLYIYLSFIFDIL